MLYVPMHFGELTLDGVVYTGALSNTIPEDDLRKIRVLTPQSTVTESPATNFQIMVAKGQVKNLKSFIELKLEVGDIKFHEYFCNGKPRPSVNWSLITSTEKNHTGHATWSLDFSVLFQAIENCRP